MQMPMPGAIAMAMKIRWRITYHARVLKQIDVNSKINCKSSSEALWSITFFVADRHRMSLI